MTPWKYEKELFNLQKYPNILVFQVIIDKVTYTLVRKLFKRSRDVAYDMIFMTMPEARTVVADWSKWIQYSKSPLTEVYTLFAFACQSSDRRLIGVFDEAIEVWMTLLSIYIARLLAFSGNQAQTMGIHYRQRPPHCLLKSLAQAVFNLKIRINISNSIKYFFSFLEYWDQTHVPVLNI